MSKPLPARASLEWLKKTAKQHLRALRAADTDTKLSDAQLALAREYGFRSWRALKAHVEESPPDEEEVARFLRSVAEDEVESVRAALAAKQALVNAAGPHPYWGGRPQPLHVAIEKKRRDMFDLLLDAGADVNGGNEAYDRWSPLMLACSDDRRDMRKALLERGARIGLVEALLMKDDALVEKLLQDGLPDVVPNDGSILAFARTPFAIDRLLEHGASATQKDHWGSTPVDALSKVRPEGPELVGHLMVRGAVPGPEHFARIGDRAMLETLIDADPSVARRDAVIMAAVDSGDRELVRWLLDKGANPNAQADDESRRNPLHSAAWGGDLEMVKLLVAVGADVHARDAQYDSSPCGWAKTSVNVTGNRRCEQVADWLAGLERESCG